MNTFMMGWLVIIAVVLVLIATPSIFEFLWRRKVANLTRQLESYPMDTFDLLHDRMCLYLERVEYDHNLYPLLLADLQQITLIDPTYDVSYHLQMQVYCDLEDYPNALRVNKALLDAMGVDEETLQDYYEYLLDIYEFQGNVEPVIAIIDKDFATYPDFHKVLWYMKLVIYREYIKDPTQLSEAFKQYNKAVK